MEIPNIPSNDCQAVNEGRRRNEGIAFGLRIGHVKRGAPKGDFFRD